MTSSRRVTRIASPSPNRTLPGRLRPSFREPSGDVAKEIGEEDPDRRAGTCERRLEAGAPRDERAVAVGREVHVGPIALHRDAGEDRVGEVRRRLELEYLLAAHSPGAAEPTDGADAVRLGCTRALELRDGQVRPLLPGCRIGEPAPYGFRRSTGAGEHLEPLRAHLRDLPAEPTRLAALACGLHALGRVLGRADDTPHRLTKPDRVLPGEMLAACSHLLRRALCEW